MYWGLSSFCFYLRTLFWSPDSRIWLPLRYLHLSILKSMQSNLNFLELSPCNHHLYFKKRREGKEKKKKEVSLLQSSPTQEIVVLFSSSSVPNLWNHTLRLFHTLTLIISKSYSFCFKEFLMLTTVAPSISSSLVQTTIILHLDI